MNRILALRAGAAVFAALLTTCGQAQSLRAADIEAALDRSRLTILDEAWRDAVPAALRYRLHAENS